MRHGSFTQIISYGFQAEVAMREDGKPGMSDEEVSPIFFYRSLNFFFLSFSSFRHEQTKVI